MKPVPDFLRVAVKEGRQLWDERRGMWFAYLMQHVRVYSDNSVMIPFNGRYQPYWRQRVRNTLGIDIDNPFGFPGHLFVDPETKQKVLPSWIDRPATGIALDLTNNKAVSADVSRRLGREWADGGVFYNSCWDVPANTNPINIHTPDRKQYNKIKKNAMELVQECRAKTTLAKDMPYNENPYKVDSYSAVDKVIDKVKKALLYPDKFDNDPMVIGWIGHQYGCPGMNNVIKQLSDRQKHVPYLDAIPRK